jgi:hypothetical protein
MKRVLIALDRPHARAAEAVDRYLAARGWRVWHWLGSLWVVAGVPEGLAAEGLWAALRAEPGAAGAEGLAVDLDPRGTFQGTFGERALAALEEGWGPTNDQLAALRPGRVDPGLLAAGSR